MLRAAETFPNARFIQSDAPSAEPSAVRAKAHPQVAASWAADASVASQPRLVGRRAAGCIPSSTRSAAGTSLNANIDRFVSTLPSERWLRVRGEDILRDPSSRLAEIASWLGIRADAKAVEAMLHPEHSPFAGFGPRSARYGNDLFFLCDARLRPERAGADNLDDPLEWRTGEARFAPEVIAFARRLGYD